MVKEIVLEYACHKQRLCLFIKFGYDTQLIEQVKTLGDARWSNTHKAWYITYFDACVPLVKNALSQYEVIIIEKGTPGEAAKPIIPVLKTPSDALPPLTADRQLLLAKFTHWMRSRRYGDSTIDTYTDALKVFMRYYAHKPISDITNEDLILFNNHYILANSFSASYQNQIVNAVKLFFRSIEDKKLQPDLIMRPKREKLLPNVLSKEEVKAILNAPSNIKHKAMLSLIYSCGLRRSELLNLKLKDVDSKRGLIFIKQAKGKKDRIVPLSLKILELLREYYIVYRPKEWLFEGQDKNENYSEKSLQSVLKQALEKSKIHKPVTLHWLRHSFATHLLESGTDLRYIQEILGHSRSTTTEIYTHVSNQNIQKIISPFDTL